MDPYNSLAKAGLHELFSEGAGKPRFILVFESEARRASLDKEIIQAALRGPVHIMDMGNCFNPLRITRDIRRQTLHIQQTLDHIKVARAFTCFQVITLLEQTQNPQGPVFLLRLLTTFRDEMISDYERLRLLKQVDRHMDRLRNAVPLTVMIQNDFFQDDPLLDWVSRVQNRADEIVLPRVTEQPKPISFF